jgi:hypothetical protein
VLTLCCAEGGRGERVESGVRYATQRYAHQRPSMRSIHIHIPIPIPTYPPTYLAILLPTLFTRYPLTS